MTEQPTRKSMPTGKVPDKYWYPKVVDELETLGAVLAGASIARFGDGEFNLARGGNCVSQRAHPGLREELCEILKNLGRYAGKPLLIGIPRLDKRSPKFTNWYKCCSTYWPLLTKAQPYYSSFITRPDSAPWIANDEYYAKIESLWTGKNVTMVYGSDRSLSLKFPAMATAKDIVHVSCDYAHTYHRIAEIEAQIERVGNKTVLLMCGPTATCLAARLAVKGYHAIDLGHIGMWWYAHKNPKLIPQLRY